MLIGVRGIREEVRDRLDISSLALSLRSGSSRPLDGVEAPFQLRGRLEPCGKRVAPIAQRDTPVRDRTGWIGFENGIESFNGDRKLKRMHQSDGATELGLNSATAGSSERYTAQSLRRSVVMVSLRMTHVRS